MARRLLLLCVAAAALLVNSLHVAQAAEPTSLTATAEPDGVGIAVTGTLTSNGEPVAEATIDVALDSTPSTSTTTDDGGAFRATVEVGDATVPHTLQVSFIGTADLNPATTEVEFTPPVTRQATTLSVSVADDTLYPGELITITGSLEAAGAGVANGEINVFLRGQEQGESLTFTGDNGRFTTYAEVPVDMSAGEAALRVAHPGNRNTLPSERSITLTIQQSAPEPTGDAETPAEDPTQAETTPATDDTTAAPATTEAAASPEATATDDATVANINAEPNLFSWFWVGAVVAGGCAALVTIALLMRRAATREEKRERAQGIEPLYLLGDEDDEGYEPEEHGWVTEEFFLDLDDDAASQPTDAVAHTPDASPGQTTQPIPAPTPARPAAPPEPAPEIYRTTEEPLEQPKPRRSWSGEE
ncbi:hypothetical protein GCM10028820_12860 [Tessaracoccus terricola]